MDQIIAGYFSFGLNFALRAGEGRQQWHLLFIVHRGYVSKTNTRRLKSRKLDLKRVRIYEDYEIPEKCVMNLYQNKRPMGHFVRWVTLAHMKIYFEFEYTFHFLLPHLTFGSHMILINLLMCFVRKLSCKFQLILTRVPQTRPSIPKREEMLLICALNELQHMWNF
jgi:hypothetical protein